MELQILMTLVLLVQTAILVVACIFLVKTSRRLQESTDQLKELIQDIRPRLTESLAGVSDFIRTCQPVGEQLVDISLNLKDIVETTRDVTNDVADFLKDTTDTARQQVSRVDNLLTDTVKRAETVSAAVSDTLLNPLAEVSAFVKGIRAGINYLRGERRIRNGPRTTDEEMYI